MSISSTIKTTATRRAVLGLLPLKVGKQVISVAEGGFASDKTFEVQAEAGKNYFVEYDSSKGLLLGWGMLSGSAAKTETQALADLKELHRANLADERKITTTKNIAVSAINTGLEADFA